jgi:hypothetical protein
MKKNLLSILLICMATAGFAAVVDKDKASTPAITLIDATDTIVIDLSNQTLVGGKVSFPVSIVSDETIYALDFSFKYDETNFDYDTIINLSPLLQSSAYYNTADSTVRYTSFSLDSLSKNTALVTVRLNTFSSYMCNQDINTIKGFLNGDACSIKLINCLSAGINDVNTNDKVKVYPNPATHTLNVESAQNATFVLVDLNGKVIVEPTQVNKDEKFFLNTSAFNNGVYILKLYNDSFISIKKVVVKH